MAHVNNTNTISGSAMAVLGGIVCVIAPWFTSLGFFSKLGISIVGIALIGIGARN